jgi:hypothetical protein
MPPRSLRGARAIGSPTSSEMTTFPNRPQTSSARMTHTPRGAQASCLRGQFVVLWARRPSRKVMSARLAPVARRRNTDQHIVGADRKDRQIHQLEAPEFSKRLVRDGSPGLFLLPHEVEGRARAGLVVHASLQAGETHYAPLASAAEFKNTRCVKCAAGPPLRSETYPRCRTDIARTSLGHRPTRRPRSGFLSDGDLRFHVLECASCPQSFSGRRVE